MCVSIALAVTSESYFNALSKMGEQAMQSMSSRLLGKLLFPLISFPFTLLNHSRTRFCQAQRFLIHSSFSFFLINMYFPSQGQSGKERELCVFIEGGKLGGSRCPSHTHIVLCSCKFTMFLLGSLLHTWVCVCLCVCVCVCVCLFISNIYHPVVV